MTFRYIIAKVLNLAYAKFRLCKLGLKLRVFEILENLAEVLQMLLQIGAKHQNVIQKNCHEMIQSIRKWFMHQTLECSRSIAQIF